MEEARKGATAAVLKETLAAFENEMLKEHLWAGCGPKHVANSRRPEVLTSRSTSLNLLLVHLPTLPSSPLLRDRPVGQVDAVLLEIIKWLYTQTSVLCCADASQ